MTEPESKRQKVLSDEIVGLELSASGRVFNCPLSTLRNASGYFAARFGESGIPPGSVRMDDHERSVYYIPRDTDLFANHILPFLLTNKPGDLPPFSEAPRLWRLLRDEADFFVLDGLSDLLYVTKTCHKDDPLGRGVLYWLGTGKGEHEYRNPHALGAVHVGGWVDMTMKELASLNGATAPDSGPVPWPPVQAASMKSRQALVQYKPPLKEAQHVPQDRFHARLCAKEACWVLACCGFASISIQAPAVVDLCGILLRPTAYSLRSNMDGMSYWNFEGSQDGSAWDVLHEARDEPYLRKPTQEVLDSLANQENLDEDWLLSFAEQQLRHTWGITTNKFYRYFRFSGISDNLDISPDERRMDGVGLELFGDVHQD